MNLRFQGIWAWAALFGLLALIVAAFIIAVNILLALLPILLLIWIVLWLLRHFRHKAARRMGRRRDPFVDVPYKVRK